MWENHGQWNYFWRVNLWYEVEWRIYIMNRVVFVGILFAISMIIDNVIIIRIGFQYSLCVKYNFVAISLEYPIRACSLHNQHTLIRIIHSFLRISTKELYILKANSLWRWILTLVELSASSSSPLPKWYQSSFMLLFINIHNCYLAHF